MEWLSHAEESELQTMAPCRRKFERNENTMSHYFDEIEHCLTETGRKQET